VLGWTSSWSILVEVLAGSLLVVLTVKADRLVFVGWLDNRIGRFYGHISYSFYLVHPLTLLAFSQYPCVIWLEQAIAIGIPRVVVWGIAVIVSTLAVTPLAMFMHRWIELPPIGAGKVVAGRLVGGAGPGVDRTPQIASQAGDRAALT
jgi:peptidoglycan/LPS O-acetylase OafA/YrhL